MKQKQKKISPPRRTSLCLYKTCGGGTSRGSHGHPWAETGPVAFLARACVCCHLHRVLRLRYCYYLWDCFPWLFLFVYRKQKKVKSNGTLVNNNDKDFVGPQVHFVFVVLCILWCVGSSKRQKKKRREGGSRTRERERRGWRRKELVAGRWFVFW